MRAARLARLLLDWYDRHRRRLPWRAEPGEPIDAYRVWLSEVMLQQTTVAVVAPYFRRFVARWPDVRALAAAELDDVLREWRGLGYYARARNLHRAARIVAGERNGSFPDRESALRALPGVGAYTAAAIAAMAFNARTAAVDGNVERVMARFYAVHTPLPAAKPALRKLAQALVAKRRPGDFVQAMMDLGATVCTPRRPRCGRCPWRRSCAARAGGLAERLPRRAVRRARPIRHAVAFWLSDDRGHVWLRRRPESGLLGGMMEFPSTEWRAHRPSAPETVAAAPAALEWRELPGTVAHGFTHFELRLRIWAARCRLRPRHDGLWCPVSQLAQQALPTAMAKIARHALQQDAYPFRHPRSRKSSTVET